MNVITKLGGTTGQAAPPPPKNLDPPSPAPTPTTKQQHGNVAPSLTTSALGTATIDSSTLGQSEQQLRRQGLETLTTVLRSLVAWGITSGKAQAESGAESAKVNGDETRPEGMTPAASQSLDKLPAGGSMELVRQGTPDIVDDPSRFESAKQKKTTLTEGIRRFNKKPKNGIEFLIQHGFIPSKNPHDIAHFLLTTDGPAKVAIGEYLGEGWVRGFTYLGAVLTVFQRRGEHCDHARVRRHD